MNETPAAKSNGTGIGKSLTYTCGQFGGNIVNMVFVGWIQYFYTNDIGRERPLLSMYIMGAVIFGGRIIDALSDPIVGFWSDNTRSKLGRRRPFILYGAPPLVITFILLFYPLFPAGSASLIATTAILMGLFWFFFTVVMGPYLSLIPEIAETSKQRVAITTYMSVAMLLATAYQGFVAAKMVDAKAWNIGYFNMAIISGAIALFFMYITGLGIREKYTPVKRTGEQEQKYSIIEAFGWTFKNKAFLIYILASVMQYLGFAALTSSMPFIVTRLMGKTESYVGFIYLVSIPGFVVSFFLINYISRITGKVKLYKVCLLLLALFLPGLYFIGRTPLPFSPATAGLILIAVLSFPIAGNMVLPMAILADITDYDEKLTGHRREAMYFGMQGFLQKAATALSQIMQSFLFGYFGYSLSCYYGINMLGLVAGISGLLGFLVFLKFPLDDRTPQKSG